MDIKDNKWLIVLPTVKLTPIITPVIISLDKYFQQAQFKGIVTSGLRDGVDQLRVVRSYLTAKGLDKKYPEAMTCKITDQVGANYVWQMAWSNLLNIGVIINPPLMAKCLMDTSYGGKNRKGQVINQTPHARGTAFNIGGGGNGVADEAAILAKALKDKVPGLVSYLVERENNAVHVNCAPIK